MSRKVEEREYVLGVDEAELERLRFQHAAWSEQAYAAWRLAGIRAGDVVLDLGSGPGFASLELARLVGRGGRVIARDQSQGFLGYLARERDRLGLPWVETSVGPGEELELAPGSLDATYARWLLCWLRDAGAVMERVARATKKGGVFVVQDYLDWAAVKLVPKSDAFEHAVAACMQSWLEFHATIDIGEHLPDLAKASGFELELFRPVARLGRVGSLEWQWIGQFFASYLPKLVERGTYAQRELELVLRTWQERAEERTSFVYAPTVFDAVLRKR